LTCSHGLTLRQVKSHSVAKTLFITRFMLCSGMHYINTIIGIHTDVLIVYFTL